MHIHRSQAAFLFVVMTFAIAAFFARFSPTGTGSSGQVVADVPVGTAKLSLDPATTNLKVGQAVSLNVVLDTRGDKTTGVDLDVKYDPTVLRAVNATGAGIFDLVPFNQVVAATGDVKISLAQRPPTSGIAIAGKSIATINFEAKAAGATSISFVSTPGSVSDTNVISSEGRDLLNSVTGATITTSQ